MVAISSHRPHSQSDEYAQNQIRARKSWNGIFTDVHYFGPAEPELALSGTHFVECEPWPRIKDMAAHAARQKTYYVTIINADIVLTPEFTEVLDIMQKSKIAGATTRRRDLDTRELGEDRGRDVWVLQPAWWRRVAEKISPTCRIGHNQWDAWMFGFMRYEAKYNFGEFSNVPCVFHPRHEGRHQPFVSEVDIKDKYENFFRYDTIITNKPL